MPPRQVWLFEFGCWAAIVTAAIHAALGIAMRAIDGPLNLLFAVCFAAVGAMGLVVSKRGQDDALLMYGVARSAAVASATLLVLSLTYFSIVPGMLTAAVTTCFAVSAVKAPGI
jgi:hypothetical protein